MLKLTLFHWVSVIVYFTLFFFQFDIWLYTASVCSYLLSILLLQLKKSGMIYSFLPSDSLFSYIYIYIVLSLGTIIVHIYFQSGMEWCEWYWFPPYVLRVWMRRLLLDLSTRPDGGSVYYETSQITRSSRDWPEVLSNTRSDNSHLMWRDVTAAPRTEVWRFDSVNSELRTVQKILPTFG